jgi:hypothetical protein
VSSIYFSPGVLSVHRARIAAARFPSAPAGALWSPYFLEVFHATFLDWSILKEKTGFSDEPQAAEQEQFLAVS